tara:strand:- start:541 stop:786 length:246 start_codon:yes stop_codon:yes gene_type:complete
VSEKKEKNKNSLDRLMTDSMEIPTKSGKMIIARQFDPVILTQFIQILIEKSGSFESLNKQDKEDIELAVSLIYPEAGKALA